MLSAPVKSAKRISSLFSLGSHRDSSVSSSPVSPAFPDTNDAAARPRSGTATSRPTRIVSQPNLDVSDSRLARSPGPSDYRFDLDDPLPPPPSLLAVNQDLAQSPSSHSLDSGVSGRPQSRGRRRSQSRPASAAGLFVPGTNNSSQNVSSAGPDSRPGTPSKRRSWIPGRTRASSVDTRGVPPTPQLAEGGTPQAWIAGLDQKIAYDLGPLARGDQIPELWNDAGDTYVYLFPQNTGRPPSFKVHSTVFAESPSLTFLARGTDPKVQALDRQAQAMSLGGAGGGPGISGSGSNGHIGGPGPAMGPHAVSSHIMAENDNDSSGSNRMAFVDDDAVDEQPPELHLYLPIPLNCDVSLAHARISPEDTETLLLFRNLFAFLLGQALIATPRSPSLFSIFMDVASLLSRFEFTNFDGSNFGETATTSFGNYCDELHLPDVRRSREKTIEAIVLGERLRFYPLYLEGFVHGVGKLDELKQLRSPKFGLIHPITQKRLERGFIDLDTRLRVLYSKLNEFDFPSVFSGAANSTTSAESKVVRFKTWKAAFADFRRFTHQYYRHKYGSWPPKARSKKNQFEENGLNRQVLKDLYHDFTDLYDMLVDRTALTDRTMDSGGNGEAPPAPSAADPHALMVRALRLVMSEYDHATPPVQPPIPFDIPQFPSLKALHSKPMDAKKEAKRRAKKLKDTDVNAVLMDSYTREGLRATPFIESFMQFERRCAHGKTLNELIDIRCGQWIFLYCVIQALPLLVVDVPNVKYTDAVEYFLCIAPRGGAPWIQNDSKTARSWFGVAGGAGVVSLPSDVVVNGVEGIYRRSHCWHVAEQWADKDAILEPPTMEDHYDNDSSFSSSPYQGAQQSSAGSSSDPSMPPPPQFNALSPPPAIPRNNSPALGRRAEHRHSIYPGLEALPLPAGVAPIEPPARPVSRFNPTMSFDDILKQVPQKKK